VQRYNFFFNLQHFREKNRKIFFLLILLGSSDKNA
jgi:hypothetical protein